MTIELQSETYDPLIVTFECDQCGAWLEVETKRKRISLSKKESQTGLFGVTPPSGWEVYDFTKLRCPECAERERQIGKINAEKGDKND